MNPESPDATSPLNLVRQQLILAQVRIMELEDIRDELTPRLAQTAKLLEQAQLLADAKIDEAAHATRVLAGLQTEFQHLRHVQHLTHEALTVSREELGRTVEKLAVLTSENQQITQSHQTLAENLTQVSADLGRTAGELAARNERIAQLDLELRRMKTSRSWRWTQPIRALERWWNRHPTP